MEKRNHLGIISAVLIISAFSIFLLTYGCSREETTGPVEPNSYVTADMLICNPLAPAPGDTATLTLETSGFSPDKLPEVYWTVEAGSLSTDEGISIKWIVPDTTGVFLVKARTTIDGVTDTTSRYIMVRNFVALDTGLKISLYPHWGSNGLLYFVGWKEPEEEWDYSEYNVYKYVPGNSEILTEWEEYGYNGGHEFTYYGDKVLGSFLTRYYDILRSQSYNVAVFPLFGFTSRRIITDDEYGAMKRKNQHVHPWGSDDLSMIVWQKNILGPKQDGTEDRINIGFNSDIADMTLTVNFDSVSIVLPNGERITKARFFRNIKPMITPDKDYVIYFVDSTGVFEPCMIPIVGGVPDTNQRRALMVDESTGIFAANGVRVDEKTIYQFNPVYTNIVAFIDAIGNMCFFDYTMEDVQIIQLEGKAEEFAWSPDGEQCAIVTEAGINIVSVSGSGGLVLPKEKSYDRFIGVNWAPDTDKRLIAFRMLRKGKSEVDTYSAIVIFSVDEDIWYYASPRVAGNMEPDVPYTWLRVVFAESSDRIYVAMPVEEPDIDTRIFYSYN